MLLHRLRVDLALGSSSLSVSLAPSSLTTVGVLRTFGRQRPLVLCRVKSLVHFSFPFGFGGNFFGSSGSFFGFFGFFFGSFGSFIATSSS